jgi:ethanolamine utilization protein EutN
MQIAIVQGRATSTVKHKSLQGARLLICQSLGIDGKASGDPVIAVDKLGAGDKVLISSDGGGLREVLKDNNSPARWWTIGIVDEKQ